MKRYLCQVERKTPEIYFKDDHLLLVIKPAGWVCETSDRDHHSVEDWMSEQLEKQGERPYFKVVHRLDKPVSGLLLGARSASVLKSLFRQWEERSVLKKYRAWVHGILSDPSGKLEHFLARPETGIKARIQDDPKEGFKPCSLTYQVIRQEADQTLIEIELQTGRYHQIRAQFSHIDHPVVGDGLYGMSGDFTSIQLQSSRLRVTHPVTKEIMDWKLPSDQLFR